MDLGCRSSLESVTDNELVSPESVENLGEAEIEIRNNGKCHVDIELLDAVQVEGFGGKPSSDTRSSPPAATKGRGLKKWRRVPREVGRTANTILDGNTKRDLSVSTDETRQRSDASISKKNAMLNVLDIVSNRSPLRGDSELEDGPIFAAGDDSENSEDHSSRSSTTASAVRARHEMLPLVGVELDWNNIRSLNVNNLGTAAQYVGQQGKGRTVIRKKAKENSHSSMESDSRSSNFVFVQGTNSVTNNGKQSGREANYENEYNDDAQNHDKHLNKEAQAAFRKNEAESGDVSQDSAAENLREVKEEKSENHVGSVDHDVLTESMMTLHSAQEALEREVQKLKDVGGENPLFFEDLIQPSESSNAQGHEASSFVEFQSGESRPSSSNILETQTSLKQKVVHGDLETEREEVLKQRIEVEVQYVAISQYLKTGLMVQQKILASEQVKVMDQLEGAESKATELKRQAKKLEVTCEGILESEEVWKLRNGNSWRNGWIKDKIEKQKGWQKHNLRKAEREAKALLGCQMLELGTGDVSAFKMPFKACQA